MSMSVKLVRKVFGALFLLGLLRTYSCNICDECVCAESENKTRTISCLGHDDFYNGTLNASGNALDAFPNCVYESLQILDLTGNKLKKIPTTLTSSNLPHLEVLLLDENPIENLFFVNDLRLRELRARRLDHLVTIVTGAFRSLQPREDCVDLVISGNRRLSVVEAGAFDGVAIRNLDLSENALVRLSPEAIKAGPTFVARGLIDLQGNPFKCQCESQWMLDDLVPHVYRMDPERLANLRCNAPKDLEGTRMVHWYNWKIAVFCQLEGDVASRLTQGAEPRAASHRSAVVRLGTGPAMLATIVGATGTLCVLVIIGIFAAKKFELRRRRTNRRF